MSKKFLQSSFMVILVLFAFGCSSSGIRMRSYMKEKKRVDQQQSGNMGYLMGESKEQPAKVRETRKVYVLEITKELEDEARQSADQSPSSDDPAPAPIQPAEIKKVSQTTPDVTIPSFNPQALEFQEDFQPVETAYIEYKVTKNDTLQKISKKFYNSYSKWPKIYEANREKIKNPDKIKPGITLRIPKE